MSLNVNQKTKALHTQTTNWTFLKKQKTEKSKYFLDFQTPVLILFSRVPKFCDSSFKMCLCILYGH